MITQLLNEVNKKIETLNNLVQDKEYFEKLDERIEKVNNYVQKQKQEIERLNNIINEANKILSNILVVNDRGHKGKYRPVKNTTSQEVYKSVCMLYGILKTPYRSDYGSLQELKGSGSNE